MQVKYDNSARHYLKHHPPLDGCCFSGFPLLPQGDVRAALEVAQEIRRLTKDLGKPSKEAETQLGRTCESLTAFVLRARYATMPGPPQGQDPYSTIVSCFRIPVFLQAISWNEI